MSTPKGSVSFDGAADTYDATRAWPEHVQRAQTEALLAQLDGRRVLEIGVGTGRIARPLAERGVRVTGVDIAPRMLARLIEQLDVRHTKPDLLLADATRLPFADASFGAAYAVHVLHLVSDWQATLEELRRVLAPGGIFVHHNTHHEPDGWAPHIEKWKELLARRGFTPRVRPSAEQIASKLRELGASLQSKVYAEDEERHTAAFFIEETRNRVGSWSWEIPDEIFADCLPAYEAFMRDYYGDLHRELVQRVTYEIDVWTFP